MKAAILLKKALLLSLQGILMFCGGYYLWKFCHAQTDGFTVLHISSSLSHNERWEVPTLTPEEKQTLTPIFDQKYFYLGCGGQCYAFASEDGQYVIKFFKHHLRQTSHWLDAVPKPSFLQKAGEKKKQKKLSKLYRDFDSYKIAYTLLPEETGVFYIHLNKSSDLQKRVKIVDKIGIEHQIDLDSTEFILQKKAELVYSRIDHLMEQKDFISSELLIHSLLDVIVSRSQKGVFDEDAKIHRNFGCIGNKVIVIDVGRFRQDPSRAQPEVYQKDLSQITLRFRKWIEESHPELLNLLDNQLAQMLNDEKKAV